MSRKSKSVFSTERLIAENSARSSNTRQSENIFERLKSNWLIILIIGFFCVGAFGAGLKYLEEDAKREMAKRESNKGKMLSDKDKSDESLLNSINPFLPAPLPSPTPQLSKEYI